MATTSLQHNRLWWLVALAGICCVGSLGCSAKTTLPPADDALLSYVQAAHSLAMFLHIDAPPRPEENREQQFEAACAQLESLQKAAAAIPPAEQSRLLQNGEYAGTAQSAQAAWKDLVKKQEVDHKIAADKWTRVERAFDLCGQLKIP